MQSLVKALKTNVKTSKIRRKGSDFVDKGFDIEFTSDDELEAMLDEFIDNMKDEILGDESRTTVLNPVRMQQLQFAYAALKYITRDTEAEIFYKLYEPFKTMGSVTAEARLLEFDKPEWFARVAEFASNTEVYPLANGNARLTFTFHGLTAPIE